MSDKEPDDQKQPDPTTAAEPDNGVDEEKKATAEAAAPEPRAPGKPREKPSEKPASTGGAGVMLAVFLALVAIGIAGYPAYLAWQDSQNQSAADPVAARVDSLSGDIQNLSGRLTALAEEQAAIRSQAGAGQADVDQKLEALSGRFSSELEVIRDELGTSSQDWLYAEVEYLIRMANQRALMERDTESALQLLTSADHIVRDAEGLTAHALREALALDIAALQAVNQPDVQGIFLKLSGLVSQVPSLKRNMPTYEPRQTADMQTTPPAGWLDRIQRLLANGAGRLAELVDFRRGDIEIRPILPPAEEYYLRQNLILKLQMAQLALLEGDTPVFQTSVREAAGWVTDYFDAQDPAAIAMSQSLAALADADISAEIPDISRSLIAVRRQLENFSGESVR